MTFAKRYPWLYELMSTFLHAAISQVLVSANHGSVTFVQEDTSLASSAVSEPSTSVSGFSWQVNAALRSLVYVSAEDWHGWDKIAITVTDLGYDDFKPDTEPRTYELHLSVAAVNDGPVLEAAGFESVTIEDEESLSGAEAFPAFLVPAQEDTAKVITAVAVSDVDTEASGAFLSRPDGFVGTVSTDGMGNGAELLALEPNIALSLSCEYGLLAFGEQRGGLRAEEGDLDGLAQNLSVTGTISNINAALAEGIVYTPSENWNGIDVIEVRLRLCQNPLMLHGYLTSHGFAQARPATLRCPWYSRAGQVRCRRIHRA